MPKVRRQVRVTRLYEEPGDPGRIYADVDDVAAGEPLGKMRFGKDLGLKVGDTYAMVEEVPSLRGRDVFVNTAETMEEVGARLKAGGYTHFSLAVLTGEQAWGIWNKIARSVPDRFEVKHDGRTVSGKVMLRSAEDEGKDLFEVLGSKSGLVVVGEPHLLGLDEHRER